MPITIGVVEISQYDKLPSEERNQASGLFRAAVTQFLADCGFAFFAYQRSNAAITIVLPSETIANSQEVTEQLSGLFKPGADELGLELNYSFHLISPPQPFEAIDVQATLGQAEGPVSAVG